MHVSGDHDGSSGSPALAVDDSDILRILVEPALDLLTDGAETVQWRCQLIRPSEFDDVS